MRHFRNSKNTSRIYRYILKVFSDLKHLEYLKSFLKWTLSIWICEQNVMAHFCASNGKLKDKYVFCKFTIAEKCIKIISKL